MTHLEFLARRVLELTRDLSLHEQARALVDYGVAGSIQEAVETVRSLTAKPA